MTECCSNVWIYVGFYYLWTVGLLSEFFEWCWGFGMFQGFIYLAHEGIIQVWEEFSPDTCFFEHPPNLKPFKIHYQKPQNTF